MDGLAYQLAVMQRPQQRSPVDMVTGGQYGFRYNSNQPKGNGWLGNVGSGDTAVTEYSTEYKGREIPTLIPGLSKEQVATVVKEATTGERQNLDSTIGLARKFADDRAQLGYGPFKD
jgi:hypothetical protein